MVNRLKHFQVFITAKYAGENKDLFERNIYLLRKQAVVQLCKQNVECYVVSLSSSTVVYKVMFRLSAAICVTMSPLKGEGGGGRQC